MTITHYLAGFYAVYFAFVGGMAPFLGLYLAQKNFDAVQISMVLSLMQVMRIFAPSLWGYVADRTQQPVRVVRWASVASALSCSFIGWAQAFTTIFIVIAVMSFFWNATLPLVEVQTLNTLGKAIGAYGRIRLWGSLGFLLTVLGLGWFFDSFNVGYLPWFLIAIQWAIVVLAWCLPVTARAAPSVVFRLAEPVVVPLRTLLKQPVVWGLLLACFFMGLANGPYYTFYSLHLSTHGYNKTWIGGLWALGVVAEIGVFIFMAPLMQRFGLRGLLLLSFIVTAGRFVAMGWGVEQRILMVLLQLLHAMTFGTYHAAALAAIHRCFAGVHQARGQALYSSVSYGVGGSIGAMLAGQLWAVGAGAWAFTLGGVFALWGAYCIARYVHDDDLNSMNK